MATSYYHFQTLESALGSPFPGMISAIHRLEKMSVTGKIATVKSHMRRFINEGNDIKSASDMKSAIYSYGGVKVCQSAKAGIQSLYNFSFESTGLQVWKAYGVGPGKLITHAQLKQLGTPQGPTGLIILKPFDQPRQQRSRAITAVVVGQRGSTGDTQQATVTENQPDPFLLQVTKEPEVQFPCPEEGCIKTYQSCRCRKTSCEARTRGQLRHHQEKVGRNL